MSAPENPPAFPNTGNSTWDLAPAPGMTLRDWFAGQALSGLMVGSFSSATITPEQADDIARECGLIADAMLTEREAASLAQRSSGE